MIIAATSDTHGRTSWTIPECGVFIHCGDITGWGTIEEMELFANWLKKQKQAKHKIITFGNHDKCAEESIKKVRRLFDSTTTVLIDEGVEVDGKTFWASPHTPPFMNWSFMKTEEKLAEAYKEMPENLDVLITHGPPYGILDPGYKQDHAGSLELRKAVSQRNIKHHIFGHLHGGGGKNYYDPDCTETKTLYHNVAACNEAYQLVNLPIVFEI